jgi:Holliday junction resolvase RusA-like endonuclease
VGVITAKTKCLNGWRETVNEKQLRKCCKPGHFHQKISLHMRKQRKRLKINLKIKPEIKPHPSSRIPQPSQGGCKGWMLRARLKE